MQGKDVIGLVLAAGGIFGGLLVACLFKKLRDVFFVMMIFLSPMTELVDINFVSRDFYRGTTRGFEFSIVDILSISLVGSILLFPKRGQVRGFWPAGLGLMLLLFFYAVFNVAIADPMLFGLFELLKMLRGLGIFLAVALYVRGERELRLFLWTLATMVCFQCLMALKQRYINGIHRVPGTVDDSNSLSVFLCTTAPVMVAIINARVPKLMKLLAGAAAALACVGVILTISRAGVVIMGLVMFGTAIMTMTFNITARKIIICLLVLIGVGGVLGKSWKTLKARFAESNLKQEYGNNKNLGRGYYIRVAKAVAADQLFGVGLNNWSYWVSNKYGPRLGYRFVAYKGTDKEPSTIIPSTSNVDEAQAAPAHSLGALMTGELGYPGLVIFALVWMRWFQMGASFFWPRLSDPMRRLGVGIFFGLLGLFLQSLTEWVFRQSPIYYMAHILLGVLAALYYNKKQEKKLALKPQPIRTEIFVAPLAAHAAG